MQLVLGRPVDDHDDDDPHQEGPQEPELEALDVPHQHGGAAADQVTKRRKDERAEHAAKHVDQEKARQAETVETPKQHARGLGAVDKPRSQQFPRAHSLRQTLDRRTHPPIEPSFPKPAAAEPAQQIPRGVTGKTADSPNSDRQRKGEEAQVQDHASQDQTEVSLERGADQNRDETIVDQELLQVIVHQPSSGRPRCFRAAASASSTLSQTYSSPTSSKRPERSNASKGWA